ncbi:hypothetical protein CHUAL_011509 [Chamberlinius hualienensis]
MTTVKAENIETDFLPLIYDIIRSIEKETADASQKLRDSHDTYQKIMDLKMKLQQCRAQINKLNGIDYSKDDQLKRLDALRKQLVMKRELLLKYRNMCHFSAPK